MYLIDAGVSHRVAAQSAQCTRTVSRSSQCVHQMSEVSCASTAAESFDNRPPLTGHSSTDVAMSIRRGIAVIGSCAPAFGQRAYKSAQGIQELN
jgi:hypothetical protein